LENKIKKTVQSVFSSRNKVIFYLKLLIAGLLIYFLISQYSNYQFTISLQKVNYYFLATAVLLWFPNIFLQYMKWEIVCVNLLDEHQKWKIFSSLFIGFSAGLVTPFRVGEYAGRNIPFKEQSVFNVTFATFVDNICHLAVIFFVGAFTSVIFIEDYYNPSFYLIFFLTVTLIFLLLLFIHQLFNPRFLKAAINKARKKKYLKKLLDKREIFDRLRKTVIIKNISLSLLLFICYNLQFALLVIAFSGSYSILQFFIAGILVMFAKTVIPPVSFGELGIREGASIFFISNIGLSGIFGLYASLTLFFMNVLLPSLIGLFFLLRRD